MINPAFAEKIKYYRYKDKDGAYVIDSTLPAEYANDGYDIVTPRGNVIERIPARKSDELLKKEALLKKKLEAQKLRAKARQKQAIERRRKDEVLLKMYSSTQDIIRSRDEKIQSLDIVLDITKDNIKRQKTILKSTKARIDQLEKENQPIPESLKVQYEKTKLNIKNSKDFIKEKELFIKKIRKKYQKQIERFDYLESKKELNQPN